MDPVAIRTLYDYHFALNRRLWDECIRPLTDGDFVRDLDYSHGSIRNQAVHVIGVDERWFARIEGTAVPPPPEPSAFPDRAAVRARWDTVEDGMRRYLARLTEAEAGRTIDFTLARSPRPLRAAAWQILVHVVNHGTDHRAQMLAMLHRLGAPTLEQDLILWLNRL